MNKKQQAFTLVELMVVVTILGILATMALPNFLAMIKRHELKVTANDYYVAFRYARSEAIRSGKAVNIKLLDESAGWHAGFELIKVHDPLDTTKDEVLRQVAAKKGVTVEESGDLTSIQFDGKGYVTGDTKLFEFCNGRTQDKSYQVVILGSGFSAIKNDVQGC